MTQVGADPKTTPSQPAGPLQIWSRTPTNDISSAIIAASLRAALFSLVIAHRIVYGLEVLPDDFFDPPPRSQCQEDLTNHSRLGQSAPWKRGRAQTIVGRTGVRYHGAVLRCHLNGACIIRRRCRRRLWRQGIHFRQESGSRPSAASRFPVINLRCREK
jgi:hypothetical protein